MFGEWIPLLSEGMATCLAGILMALYLVEWSWWRSAFVHRRTNIDFPKMYYWCPWSGRSVKRFEEATYAVNADPLVLKSVSAVADNWPKLFEPTDKAKGSGQSVGKPSDHTWYRQLGSFQFQVMYAIHVLGEEAYSAGIGRFIEKQTGKLKYSQITGTLHRLVDRKLASVRETAPVAKRGGRRRKVYTLEPSGVRALQSAMADRQALMTPIHHNGDEDDKYPFGSSAEATFASGGSA